MVRRATLADIDQLLDLEDASFRGDRIARRNFRHLLTKAHAVTFVDASGAAVAGYISVLFNRSSTVARVYSVAVAPEARGTGVGRRLVGAAEEAAAAAGCRKVRLEIREDNAASISLFTKLGYSRFTTVEDYYEDHAPALRFEKRLSPA
ncbi:MAG: N-acetyltransferase [Candidatus Eisenbacteria bacterium]